MDFPSNYVSHTPDSKGYINYSAEEQAVWRALFSRQKALLPGRAADAFLNGLDCLSLNEHEIPQLPDVNARLKKETGWTVMPVPALISARAFFELLANKQFPAATFIRRLDSLDYVKEPDIFHEIFGHCPMLTDPIYANFMHAYACLVLKFPEEDWALLQRLFWFTVEFGLIKTDVGLRAYGGGILSSIRETVYSVESQEPLRVLFDPVAAFRTPYRIDRLQPVYFVIDDYNVLYSLEMKNIQACLAMARSLGEFPPFFEVDTLNPSIHIHAC